MAIFIRTFLHILDSSKPDQWEPTLLIFTAHNKQFSFAGAAAANINCSVLTFTHRKLRLITLQYICLLHDDQSS